MGLFNKIKNVFLKDKGQHNKRGQQRREYVSVIACKSCCTDHAYDMCGYDDKSA